MWDKVKVKVLRNRDKRIKIDIFADNKEKFENILDIATNYDNNSILTIIKVYVIFILHYMYIYFWVK